MIGNTILNYKIIALLGKGGMGSVYLAEHTLISNEKVAIKVINANMVNDFTRHLLHDEAMHLASLNHPNIVAFKNYHIDNEGNIYLIMEYAEGITLDNYINKVNGLIVEDRIYPLFAPILDAIGAAHNKKDEQHKNGILHCDIKPANIIITKEGVPKVLDFGIARIIKEKEDGEEDGDNLIMGTPSYMSPEQVKGEQLDARSDIYSLGVLLYQMLTGNAPYDTTTLTEQEINMKVVEEPLPRMRTYYKYISDKVQKIVDKATAKNPNDRYQTCEEFKKDLHRALYPWKPSKWTKLSVAAVIALLIGAGVYIWDYTRIKTYYYKDYTERWGVPEGIGELSADEHNHSARSYRFIYQKRKLLRVSHVNSLGNLIDDGESERNERPVDQTFAYTADGNIDHVTVKDRSGKILYLQSYNAKLNTMAFQYNDEHGTERVVSNQTVGYGRLLEQNTDTKGRISRWWLDYDENGYVTTIRYAGIDNSPVGDANGIYGRKYVRDDKGRPVEIHYIDVEGNPQPTKWGLGIKRFYYDEEDNWIKAVYQTVDGKPAFDDVDGISVYEMQYDSNGNLVYAFHRDANGKAMYPKKHNVAGIHHVYDERGFEIQTEYLDAEGKPMFVNEWGYAIVKKEYDERGYVNKQTSCAVDGTPVNSKDGNASTESVNDSHGNPIEVWYYSRNGSLCEIMSLGNAGFKAEYDSVGNQTKFVNFDVNKKPCKGKSGAYGELYAYNDRNLITQITYLGVDLTPAPDNNNVIILKLDYDKRGNNTRGAFYDVDGKTLRLSGEGCAGWNDVYDDNGYYLERSFFDVEGSPLLPPGIQYAKVKYGYDNNGYLNSIRYYNVQGGLTPVKGIAGYDYINDKRGNTLEERRIGTDGSLTTNEPIIRYKYDESDNCTEMAYYDEISPIKDSDGIHKYIFTYDSRNQLIEARYYDTMDNLTLSLGYNYAVVKNEYDEKGYRVKCSYYGTDELPCICAEGWSSATYEYNQFGNITKQCFFDVTGAPTDPKIMVPVGIAEYDERGNLLYLAAQDGHGNLVNRPDGWAVMRAEYDDRNNQLTQAYFNAQDKPILYNGYHKMTWKYDKQNKCIETAYYGTDSQPVLVNNIHRITYKYAENSTHLIEEVVYDNKGKATNCAAGWHRVITTYGKDGVTPETKKFYTKTGLLLMMQQWNGEKWVEVAEEYDWQDDARRLARRFPQIESNVYDLCIASLKIIDDISCEVRFTIPYDSNELNPQSISRIKDRIREWVRKIGDDLKNKAYIIGNLYDKNDIKMYSVQY